MFKYLLGILIIQAATAAMTLAAIKSDDQELWLAVLLLAFILCLVTAFWFASIASHAKKDALANAKDEFSKERERLRVNAERSKTRLIRKSHEEIRKETNRAHAKSSFKLGAGFIGIAVALMGRNHPLGIVLASLLFGALYQGGADLASFGALQRQLEQGRQDFTPQTRSGASADNRRGASRRELKWSLTKLIRTVFT